MPSLLFSIFLGVLLAIAAPCGAGASSGRLEVAKGEFRLRLDDGRVLAREDLVGARVVMRAGGRDVQLLIDGVEEDRSVPDAPIALYRLLLEDTARHQFDNVCQPDARGRQLGLPVSKAGRFELTCTSGAEGKCILMGYRPWDDGAGAPMQDLHAACVKMVRADYGGDDHPTTRNGTTIDVYDRFGIQKADTRNSMPLEAAWGADGAHCVAHPRIAANITLQALQEHYPSLSGRLGPEACTEEAMRGDPGVLLFNRSAVTEPR